MDTVAQVMTMGASKYGERNWEKGMMWGRLFSACMRHMWAWWGGEKNDPESDMPHLAHATCCVLFLLAFELRQMGQFDSRPTTKSEPGQPPSRVPPEVKG